MSACPRPVPRSGAAYSAVEWLEDGRVAVLDQRLLPLEEHYELITTLEGVAQAISAMLVRGAPAIGVAAGYGMALAARLERGGPGTFLAAMESAGARLSASRPTAVNLAWAVGELLVTAREVATLSPPARGDACLERALRLHDDDVASCRRMGALGAALLPDCGVVMTHCNAGALATGGYGTALGLIRAARAAGKQIRVIACETRPYLQGSRLTAWELSRDGFDVSIACDSMVGHLLSRGVVACAVVGADRIARNGDVANKIGTYGLACLARLHDVPLYVAAPLSTIDRATADGAGIPIEVRAAIEVTEIGTPGGRLRIAPEGVGALHPAFDVTPARLVSALVTERGIASPLNEGSLLALCD